MAPDLDPVAGGAVVVGGVDDPHRQPQDALLDLVEDVEVDAGGGAGRGPRGLREGQAEVVLRLKGHGDIVASLRGSG